MLAFVFFGFVHGILGASSGLRLRAFNLPKLTVGCMTHVLAKILERVSFRFLGSVQGILGASAGLHKRIAVSKGRNNSQIHDHVKHST